MVCDSFPDLYVLPRYRGMNEHVYLMWRNFFIITCEIVITLSLSFSWLSMTHFMPNKTLELFNVSIILRSSNRIRISIENPNT